MTEVQITIVSEQQQQQQQQQSQTKSSSCTAFVPHLALIFTQLCFSGWHILSSLALGNGANPLVFAFYREITASICMCIYVYFLHIEFRIYKEDICRYVFLGFCSFVNVVGSVFALDYISPTKYALFQPTIPCIATLLSITLRLEKITILKLLGIALAFAGAVIVTLWDPDGNLNANDSNPTLGLILVICQVTCMASLIVFQKPLLSKYEPVLLTFAYYSIGSLFTCVMMLIWIPWLTAPDMYFNHKLWPWLTLIYAVLFPTFFAYNAYSWAGKRLIPSVTTVYSTLQPVGTGILSYVVLDQQITVGYIVGGIVVIIGLFVTVYGERHRELQQQEEDFPESSSQRSLLTSTFSSSGYTSKSNSRRSSRKDDLKKQPFSEMEEEDDAFSGGSTNSGYFGF